MVALPTAQADDATLLQSPVRSKSLLTLHDRLFPDHEVPIQLIHVGSEPGIPENFPSQVMVPNDYFEHDIQNAIQEFGFAYHAYSLPTTGFAFVTPVTWTAKKDEWHYVYYPLQFNDRSDIILHRASQNLSEHGHMALLHSLGLERVVILCTHMPRSQLVLVQYHNNKPALDGPELKSKVPTAWPKRQVIAPKQPFFQAPSTETLDPEHLLAWDLTLSDLQQLFTSGETTLCTWHSHLQVPDFVRDALAQTTATEGSALPFREFDRLIVYTDGSSKPSNRRKAPLWVHEKDIPDAWAFVVLGEKYGSHGNDSTITFLGWHSQPVLYESSLPHFLGTDAIGSEFAEREGLFWAGLWRLGINCTIPTVFRTDASTTAEQASGCTNCHDNHATFVLLRCVFQALAAGLTDEGLIVEHVAGHAGDAWNELADHLAKTEAAHGHKLTRQQIDLRKWAQFLPFLWMAIHREAGLPTLTSVGLDITPPQMPSTLPRQEQAAVLNRKISAQFALSLASFNVGSLFVGPDGFAGKLQYLREQMKSFRINIIGLQDTRSPAGMSTADDVLRLAGGSFKGQYGIEIWINLAQPISLAGGRPHFLKKSHVQIVHADPRRLLAPLAHIRPLTAMFLPCMHPRVGDHLVRGNHGGKKLRRLLTLIARIFLSLL